MAASKLIIFTILPYRLKHSVLTRRSKTVVAFMI